jgi:hypothetical protein
MIGKKQCSVMLAMILGLYGCGAIFNGSRQNITVTSAPDGAHVESAPTAGTFTTPTTLSLHRKRDYTLTFSREGYSSASTVISHHSRAGIIVLDVLFTGLIGVIVDASTGAWNKLSPENVSVALTKIAAIPGPDSITVTLQDRKGGIHVEASAAGVSGQWQGK